MSLRDTITSQQLLAASLAVIMLVSMGGMAFIGGAGAQTTGGTFDSIIDDREDAGNQFAIEDDGSVQLFGSATDNADGTVEVTTSGDFAGAALTPDRVTSLVDGIEADPATEPADFLVEAPDDVAVDSNNDEAFPAIFVEFDPQSDFSQIEDVNGDQIPGEHDFILAGNASELDDLVDTDLSAANGDITDDNQTVAISVDNTGSVDPAVLVAEPEGTPIGAVFDGLVGEEDSDLQNENIDDVLFAAGASVDTQIQAVQLADDTTQLDAGVTAHSELIGLDDGTTTTFFNSITNASSAAGAGDNISVEDGIYHSLEDATISLADADLTLSGSGDDAIIETQVETTADGVTVENVAIVGNNDAREDVSAGTGLNISSADVTVEDTRFAGFETQIDGNADSNESALLAANDFDQAALALDTDDEILGDAIFGSINAADAEADVVTVDVRAGTYDHDEAVTIDTNDVSVVGTDTPTIVNNVDLNATTDVSVDGFDIEGDLTATATDNPDVTLESLNFTEAGTITINNADALSIDDAEFQGPAGSPITVSDATTSATITNVVADEVPEQTGVSVTTASEDITVDGVDITYTDNIGSVTAVNVSDSATVSVANVTVDAVEGATDVGVGTAVNAGSADGDVTVDSVTITDDAVTTQTGVSIGDRTASGAVTVSNINIADVQNLGVSVGPTDSVSVTESDFTFSAMSLMTGVDVGPSNNVEISGVTVDGDGNDVAGINITDIDTSVDTNSYVVDNNELINLGDGTALAFEEAAGIAAGEGELTITNNNMTSDGSQFTGVSYNATETENVTISGNTIVGGDVTGQADSVGIDFVEVAPFEGESGGILGEVDETTTMNFEDNVITNHARSVQDRNQTVTSADYTAIANSSNELNNEIGTLVIGPDGNYRNTYGSATELHGDVDSVNTYLPGSVADALDLVEQNDEISEADLVVSALDGVEDPDTYVDRTATFPDEDAVSVTGANADVTVETNFIIQESTAKNNHDIADLTIINEDASAPAIDVTSQNAQSDFSNLDVTSDNVGLNVETTGDDVNVVTLTNSEFDITAGTDGVVLATDGDDRDGFILEDVTVSGPGIGEETTGLNLAGVEKPGKDGLDTNLTVTGVSVSDFGEQVVLSQALVDAGLTAEDVYEGTNFVDNSEQIDITFAENDFEHAALVFELDRDDLPEDEETDALAEVAGDGLPEDATLANETTLFGSIDLASNTDSLDAATTTDIGIVDVRGATSYEESGNTVDLQSTANATELAVLAPGADTTTVGSITLSAATDYTDAYLTGFEAVDDSDGAVVSLADSTDVVVEAVDVRSDGDTDSVTGIEVTHAADNSTDLIGVTVEDADTDAGEVLNSSVVLDSAGPVNITDSTLSSTGLDGVGVNADAHTGVLTITDTDVTDHDTTGVSVVDGDLTLTGDTTVSDNGAAGVASTGDATVTIGDGVTILQNAAAGVDITDAGEVNINSGSTISDNAGDGVVLAGGEYTATLNETTIADNDHNGTFVDSATVELAMNESIVSGNDLAGVALDDVATESEITRATIENNDVGLEVGADVADADLTVVNNAFANEDLDISSEGDLTATLNYFGDAKGPGASSAAGVTDNVVYDPFLTEDLTAETDVSSTTSFGHDVVVEAGAGFTTVGFPAVPEEGQTIGDVFETDVNGTVFAFDAENQQFTSADADTEIEAFDAFVVDSSNAAVDQTVLIEYASEESAVAPSVQLQEGLNFVAAPAAGNASDVGFTNDESDVIQERFGLGSNLYGTGAQTDDTFADPDERFTESFATGAGDLEVHPHAGYLVTVQDGNSELLINDRIFPGVTADNIGSATDETVTA